MMRKTLFATWGILLLFSADHASAEHFSLSFSKFCEAENVNGPDASTANGPTEPKTEKAQAKTNRPAEDVALSDRLQSLIENKLQQYVLRLQDRTAVEAFYRGRDFAPLWVNAEDRFRYTTGDRLLAWSRYRWTRSEGLPDTDIC